MKLTDANVQTLKGRWIEHKDYPGLAYLCSKCNYFTTIKSNYCPNCGASMKENNNEMYDPVPVTYYRQIYEGEPEQMAMEGAEE